MPGRGGDGFTAEDQQLRISDCELRIEFEEGVCGGKLSPNPQFEIRNPQFLSHRLKNEPALVKARSCLLLALNPNS